MDLRVQAPGNAREPCPDRITDDVGFGFAIGTIGGGAWHFLNGLRNSPRGSRLLHAAQVVRMKTPRTATTFAVWSGVFALVECGLVYSRHREDPWNPIISGAVTGGFLQMRRGFGPASRSALLGGLLVALLEGVAITFTKIGPLLPKPPQQPTILVKDPHALPLGMDRPAGIRIPENTWVPLEDDAAAAASQSTSASTSSSWFGRWFGWWKERGTEKKIMVLESSCDAPTFEFK